MFFLTVIFFVSFFAASGMLLFRGWQMKQGKVPVPFSHGVDFSYRFHALAVWERKMWQESRRLSMAFGAKTLRVAVTAIDRVRIEMRKLIVQMEDSLMKKHAKDPQGAPSFFLKEIGEHKKKIHLSFQRKRE